MLQRIQEFVYILHTAFIGEKNVVLPDTSHLFACIYFIIAFSLSLFFFLKSKILSEKIHFNFIFMVNRHRLLHKTHLHVNMISEIILSIVNNNNNKKKTELIFKSHCTEDYEV